MVSAAQADLFRKSSEPEGFRYRTGVVAPAEEQRLTSQIADLPLKEFLFQGSSPNGPCCRSAGATISSWQRAANPLAPPHSPARLRSGTPVQYSSAWMRAGASRS